VQSSEQPAILSLFPEGSSVVDGEIAISGVHASDLAAAFCANAFGITETG